MDDLCVIRMEIREHFAVLDDLLQFVVSNEIKDDFLVRLAIVVNAQCKVLLAILQQPVTKCFALEQLLLLVEGLYRLKLASCTELTH